MTLSPGEKLERDAALCTRRNASLLVRIFSHPNHAKAAELYSKAAYAYGNANQYLKSAELFYKAAEVLLLETREPLFYEAAATFVKSAETFYLIDRLRSVDPHARALEINLQNLLDFPMAAMIAVKIAKTFRELHDHEAALEHFYRAADLYKKAQMLVTRRNTLSTCAEIELALKRYDRALAVHAELARDASVPYAASETNALLFVAVLCSLVAGRAAETPALLAKMDRARVETKIAAAIVAIRSGASDDLPALDELIAFYEHTAAVSPNLLALLTEVRAALDPENNIL